jgi:L-lactate dehydrogenase complex protein LldF
VKINIPEVLIHLRHKVVQQQTAGLKLLANPEAMALKSAALIFRSERRFRAAQRLGRMAEWPLVHKEGQGEGWIGWLPGLLGGWTQVRDLREMPRQTFREWFEARENSGSKKADSDGH